MDYREKILYLLNQHKQDSKELKASISELKNALADVYTNVVSAVKTVEAPRFMDLDLPSGTKWMTKNLGAKRVWDYGLYFQWGSIVGYSDDDAKTHSLWKYCPGNNGKEQVDTEALKEWDKNHLFKSGNFKQSVDAAFNYTNGVARLPSDEQIKELRTSTNIYIVNNFQGSGINGTVFASKKDESKYIFIPSSGAVFEGDILERTNMGVTWAATYNPNDTTQACTLTCNNSKRTIYNGFSPRYTGLCIRAVLA